jgi:F0F1-type ATP synthase assembly protein I
MSTKKDNALKYLNFALSFGLTLLITLYFLYKGGVWLDQRLGTDPLFMILGVFLALATVFRQLITEVTESKQKSKQDEQKKAEKKDGENR